MPEVLTKHPEVVIKVLESAGAKCGDGLPQKILTGCPKDAFCALPGGETCVYGLDRVGKMTQIDRTELSRLVCGSSSRTEGCAASAAPAEGGPGALVIAAALALGFAAGRWSLRRATNKRY